MKRNVMIAAAIAVLLLIAGATYVALSTQAPGGAAEAKEFGTVSGIVTDQNKVGIPGASVTLWKAGWNNTSGIWEKLSPLEGMENPQLTNNGSTAAPGMYTFYRVPYGAYNVTAEMDGHVWYSVLILGPGDAYADATFKPGSEYGTATHNIAIPDYSYMP